MTEPDPTYQTANQHQDVLPRKAQNLARRALSIAKNGNGVFKMTLVVHDGRWLLVVDGQGPEDLGDC